MQCFPALLFFLRAQPSFFHLVIKLLSMSLLQSVLWPAEGSARLADEGRKILRIGLIAYRFRGLGLGYARVIERFLKVKHLQKY